ncbi:MAG: ABC transporter permease, partial [Firmicutes bacterium]|nr:ABC transporter permease [Bacillota bacterium]
MSSVFDLGLINTVIRISTPLVLAAMGGLLTFQAGVLNIAMDGFILISAFVAIWIAHVTGSL